MIDGSCKCHADNFFLPKQNLALIGPQMHACSLVGNGTETF